MLEAASRFAERGAQLFGHPLAILLFPGVCVGLTAAGFGQLVLTFALSVLAITTAQMVLLRQEKKDAVEQVRDKAMHLKLDELIFVQAGARDTLQRVEERDEAAIEDMRR